MFCQQWRCALSLALLGLLPSEIRCIPQHTRLNTCSAYDSYASRPHEPRSEGPLGLPYMRPPPSCRTFNSSAVETVIEDMKTRVKDPDLARLFENTYPNTLDTTVRYYNQSENLAFIITGDINAQWLRDTANQFAQYSSLLSVDEGLASLVKAVINNEARYISQFPYCGAFQPPKESGIPPTHNWWTNKVEVYPEPDEAVVFECKYELDSLCGFLKLSRTYYHATQDASIMNDNWYDAVNAIMRVIGEQSQPTFDENYNVISYYHWSGQPGSMSPPVPNGGNGEPKGYTGMVGTHHRPSDDLVVYSFHVPANAMLSVELGNLADMLESAQQAKNISTLARKLSSRIHGAIWNTTIVDDIFAYETNGLGSRYVMDDANVPSLLSLPYLGFLDRKNAAYVATRKYMLSRQNPYYASGEVFAGVGGPHLDVSHPWPMSQISAVFGTDDDEDILESLYLIVNSTNDLGLIHESTHVHNASDFSRPWFAWANSFFSEMLLDLAERKPYLIFHTNESYVPG